ncbi:MAG: hypothetical protein H5T64_11600 [Chloroflexi bacterium]|nr:hypothetical protein [Chloroflexota bacterium]
MKPKDKNRLLITGTIIGALAGAVIALVYHHLTAEPPAEGEATPEARPLKARQIAGLGMTVLRLIQQLSRLAWE